jgi:hypothetical protein
VFCAVLAWSRVRFVRFADNERAATTLALLAECFEELGGVPKMVLADRMGCLKGGVVANKVIPTGDYVRFATHYGFRPDWCEAADPESKGIVENLVGYAKGDLVVPQAPFDDLLAANVAARQWCAEVNTVTHSEICAIPAERLAGERELLTALPLGCPDPPGAPVGVDRLPRRQVVGQQPPGTACPHPVPQRIHDLPTLMDSRPATRLDSGNQRSEQFPFSIGQIGGVRTPRNHHTPPGSRPRHPSA